MRGGGEAGRAPMVSPPPRPRLTPPRGPGTIGVVHFGIFVEELRHGATQAGAFRDIFETADRAEAGGGDCVWLGEIPFTPSPPLISPPLPVASAIAARTPPVPVGTARPGLPLHPPLLTPPRGAPPGPSRAGPGPGAGGGPPGPAERPPADPGLPPPPRGGGPRGAAREPPLVLRPPDRAGPAGGGPRGYGPGGPAADAGGADGRALLRRHHRAQGRVRDRPPRHRAPDRSA